jgi:phospholipid/cholesterol/gamma-HCH transport system substrate-binding protein
MKTNRINNTKLGLFVLAGIIFMVITLYMIGRNRNLLGSTFSIQAVVTNVNGLVPGNNVRFKGIDVGTVKSIEVTNDTAILVTMIIDEKMKPFIRKNAIASIGTDGLMGNKLININSQPGESLPIRKGDVILSSKPVETEEMLRTLNTTNNNMEKITGNLYEITVKLNSSKSLWTLLSDTVITQDLKSAVVEFKNAGANASGLTLKGKELITKLENGNGLVNQLFTDTTLSNRLNSTLDDLKKASVQSSDVMGDLKLVVQDLKQGEGTAGLILSDTLLRKSLFNSATSIEEGTHRFNQNMEALKTNFLFKRYFKKLEKEEKENLKAKNN